MILSLSNKFKSFLLAITVFASTATLYCGLKTTTPIKAVLLDLGGVVFNTKVSIPGPLVCGIKKQIIYPYLEHLQPYQNDEVTARDEHDLRLPQLMCNWQKGTLSTLAALKTITRALKTDQTYFTFSLQKRFMLLIIGKMFNTEKVALSQIFNPEVINLVNYCKENGIKIIIASNFSPKEYKLLKKNNPEFFAECDGEFVSGFEGIIKPDPEFFKKLMSDYDLKPEECLFIDDRLENRECAQLLGISAIFPQKSIAGWTGSTQKPDFDACIDIIKKYETQRAFNEKAHYATS